MNFYEKINPPLRRKLAQFAIANSRTSILRALPARDSRDGRPYGWSKMQASALLDGVIYFGIHGQPPKVSRLLLENWYQQQRILRQQVVSALRSGGYDVAAIPAAKPVATNKVQELKAKDVSKRDETYFFYPNGEPLAVDATDEEVTLMAALLGWSVLPLLKAPELAFDFNITAGLTTSTTNQTIRLSTFNEFKPVVNGAARSVISKQPIAELEELSTKTSTVGESINSEHVDSTTLLPEELNALAKLASDLAIQLDTYSQQLKAGKLPPSFAHQSEALTTLHSRYKRVLEIIELAAEVIPKTILPLAPSEPTLEYLRVVLFEIESRRDNILQANLQREKALKILAQALNIRHTTIHPFKPLDEIFTYVNSLAAEIADVIHPATHPDIVSLTDGTHFVSLLLHFASAPDEASSIEENDPVAQTLSLALPGPVIIALLRGRLYVDEANSVAIGITDAEISFGTAEKERDIDQEMILEIGSIGLAPDQLSKLDLFSNRSQKEVVQTQFSIPIGIEESVTSKSEHNLSDVTEVSAFLNLGSSPDECKPEAKNNESGLSSDIAKQDKTPVLPVHFAQLISDDSSVSGQLHIKQWYLLEQQRFALAWHLTVTTTELNDAAIEVEQALPAWLLQCLALSQGLGPSDGELQSAFAAALEPGLEEVIPANMMAWTHRAVLVAVFLRPSLLAPLTRAQELLRKGLPEFTDVSSLCQHIVRRNNPAPLQPTLLLHYQSEQQWQQQAITLQKELKSWSTKAANAEFRQPKNHAMNAFWRYCLKRDQLIGQLLTALSFDTSVQTDEVKRLVTALQNNVLLERRLQDANLKLAANRHAWPWFRAHVAPLLSLAQRWLILQSQRPPIGGLHYQESEDQAFCFELTSLLSHAQIEVAERRKRETSIAALTALDLLTSALNHVGDLLSTPPAIKESSPELKQVLLLPLLRTPSLPLLPNGEPEGNSDAIFDALQKAAEQTELTWAAAYQIHFKSGNFAACAQMRAWKPALQEISGSADFPRSSYQADARRQEQRLSYEIGQAESALQTGVRKGYVNEQFYSEGSQLLAKQKNQLLARPQSDELPPSFPYLHRQIKSLRQRLEETRSKSVAEVSTTLDDLISRLPEFKQKATADRVSQALKENSVSIAHHYISQLSQNDDITSSVLEPTELQNFLAQIPHLEAAAANQTADEQKTSLLKGKILAGQELGEVDDKIRDEASQVLADWEELRSSRTAVSIASRKALVNLFRFVGFPPPELQSALTVPSRSGYEVLDVEQMVVKGKDECSIATFASEAQGKYKLLLTWTRLGDVADLFSRVEASTDRGLVRRPIIVLYFHALTTAQRNDLASLSRDRKRTFLVFDKLLLLYLVSSGLERRRLPLFFQLTLPFTYVRPYIIGGSNLPPEMFYGREAEKAQLLSSSSDSSCLVYGGRQLGKTAVLRDIQREYHRPENDQLVLFLDIRQLGGEGHPIKDIVEELAKLLRQTDKFSLPTRGTSNMKITKLLDFIRQWMHDASHRRLILFLDEADQFLSQDAAQQFEYTNAFKRLMDDTSRSFKVVFSGTHNVQRIYRLPNQPLSQLGSAVCIGPLITNYEARQAEGLVRRPLESLGFEFEKDELVTEILVETNYFPSLIQVFCDKLLNHLYTYYPVPEAGQRPYYRIREHDISNASRKAQAEIRTKFQLTLDLNTRFKLLAYLLASQEVFEMYGDPYLPGYTAAQLHEAARDHWPAAFGPHSSEADFEILLEEVVELSVASVTSKNDGTDMGTNITNERYYNLRTPNLRQLLGTPADIKRELNSFFHTPVPGAYQADLARDVYGDNDSTIRLPGPFTAAQYAVVRASGTSIIRGTEAAGLSSVEAFLGSQSDIHLEILGKGFEHDDNLCRRELKRIYDNRPNHQTTVVLFPKRYGLDLVSFAVDMTRQLSSDSQRMHIAFLMDSAKFMKILCEKREPFERLINSRVSILDLQAWQSQTVARWLKEEAEVPVYTARIQELTGGWHDPLFFFLERRAKHPHEDPAQLVAALSDYVRENVDASKWGVKSGTPESDVLRALVQFGEPLTQSDLESLLPKVPSGSISIILNWAEALGLVVAAAQPGTVQAQEHLSRILK